MRIVVIGSGVSGLTAAWLLARRHEVHVVEREPRTGGHTHTVDVPRPDGSTVGVDTGFITYNEATYPLFTRLLDELGVATSPSDMSWSLRCERCDLEYAGNAAGVFADPRRAVAPAHLRMLAEIPRFHRLARRLLADPPSGPVTLGGFLREHRFGHGFADHYLRPMAAAIWSSGTGAVDAFPMVTLLRFFANHGLLGVTTHHPWRAVRGGSSSYLAPLTAPYADRIHRGVGVVAVHRHPDAVEVRLTDGTTATFDAVVVATHADEALALLADPSPDEKELLGAWDYSTNEAVLHTDTTMLPRRGRAWASWNYHLDDCRRPTERAGLSYHMNRLQSLREEREYVVTLNPSRQPDQAKVLRRMTYTHPTYTPESVATHPGLGGLNGARTFFAGAYQRYGFHEDGVWSAVRAAADLGVRWPR